MLERIARRIWALPPGPAELLVWPLTALSWVYASIAGRRVHAYQSGQKTVSTLPVPVISVGNLAVGGTGKTPMTMHLARALAKKGRRVGVLTRGYGGSNEGKGPLMVSLGAGPLVTPEVAGDEAVLLAQQLGNVPIAACAKRADGGRLLLDTVPVDVLLLDDGFQHLALKRDADVVLLDGAAPFGNGMVMPRGPLREQPAALSRADLIVLREDEPASGAAGVEAIRPFGQAPLVMAKTRVTGVTDLAGNSVLMPPGVRVLAACGIAKPERFSATLASLSVQVTQLVSFADHASFSAADVSRLVKQAKADRAVAVVVTAKDAVKLAPIWPTDIPLWVVRIGLNVTPLQDRDHAGMDWLGELLVLAESRCAERTARI